MSNTKSFSSFAALNAHLRETSNRDDVTRAANLRKSAHLSKPKPGTGPRVAR